MNSPSPQPQPPPDSVWYGWILRLFHHWKVGERQVTYVWAVIVGVVGASMSLFFEWTVEVIQWLLTGIWSMKSRTVCSSVTVFRAKREMDFVITISIFPARQSAISL